MRLRDVFVLWWLAVALPSAASANAGGSLSGHMAVGAGSIVTDEPELGGGGFVDLLFGAGPFRLGGALGTYFVNDENGGRVVTPLALASAIRLEPRPVGATFRGRAGLAPGSSGDGFTADAILTVGVFLDFRVSEVISLGVGSDVSFLVGKTGRTDFLPGITLSFSPRSTP